MMNYSTIDEKELLKKEAEYISKIRNANSDPHQPAGLAMSGGGIRSASFALGALQALSNLKLVEKFDYLSTVSGGGYIGSCLSWFLNKDYHTHDQAYSLGQKIRKGARSTDVNEVLDYLRLHGKYLTPGKRIDIVSALGVVLRSMFLSFFAYFPPLVAIFHLILLGCNKCGWFTRGHLRLQEWSFQLPGSNHRRPVL
jgi:predicted acylesterase/phospholipase RssA